MSEGFEFQTGDEVMLTRHAHEVEFYARPEAKP